MRGGGGACYFLLLPHSLGTDYLLSWPVTYIVLGTLADKGEFVWFDLYFKILNNN